MDKERKLLKEVGIKPTIEPLKNAAKALQAQESAKKQEKELESAMQKFLETRKKWPESAEASPAVQAAVASLSTVSEPPAKRSFLLDLPSPTPQDYKDQEDLEKRHRQ